MVGVPRVHFLTAACSSPLVLMTAPLKRHIVYSSCDLTLLTPLFLLLEEAGKFGLLAPQSKSSGMRDVSFTLVLEKIIIKLIYKKGPPLLRPNVSGFAEASLLLH
jgi:hypothetical protein